MNKKILENYLQYSMFTDPGLYQEKLTALPDDIKKIGDLVRANFIHRTTLAWGNVGTNEDKKFGDMTKVPWYRQPEDDYLTTTASMLAELYRRDPRGFITDRKVEDKLVLTCRFVAIMMASILKSKGRPSRVRSGFATYFGEYYGGKYDDHWVTEYWNTKENRWVMIDVDGSWSIKGFDAYDMPRGKFYLASDSWLDVRSGKIDGKKFWNAGGFEGLMCISWELFYDFHCLMNSEIIYLHGPAFVKLQKFPQITEDELKEIDELATLMKDPDKNFEKLQMIWKTNKKFRLLKGALL